MTSEDRETQRSGNKSVSGETVAQHLGASWLLNSKSELHTYIILMVNKIYGPKEILLRVKGVLK